MNEYVITLTAAFSANYPVVAVQDFREWLNNQGRISVTVTDQRTGTAIEMEA